MTTLGKSLLTVGAVGAAAIVGFAATTIAQQSLTIGGNRANFGKHSLAAGFTPDPKRVNIVSGGNLNTSSMGLGSGCTGYATARPDAIVNWTGGGNLLRFFVRSSGDTTLLINDANGNWHCNDDTDGTNPMVSISNPPNGQYDVWVGSYEAGANLQSRLFITEMANQRPGSN